MATVRSSLVSLARYTSPIPPAPSCETISYGPSFVPAVIAIRPHFSTDKRATPTLLRSAAIIARAADSAQGKVSQHAFRKNGFADRFSVSYQNFLYENKAVFASIKEHEKAILTDRPLA